MVCDPKKHVIFGLTVNIVVDIWYLFLLSHMNGEAWWLPTKIYKKINWVTIGSHQPIYEDDILSKSKNC